MLYIAANAVPIKPGYTSQATFPTQGRWSDPLTKLDAFVNGTDALVQILVEETGWQDDISQEMLFRIGFNSRDPLPPFYAVRFRIYPATTLNVNTGTVDMAAFKI